jgi:hypothetical protein
MTRRTLRRLAWMGVAVCVVAVALGVTERLLAPTPSVTEANVGRLRKGMTLREVEAILGTTHQMGPSGHGAWERVWVRRSGCAWVTFDDRSGGLIARPRDGAGDRGLRRAARPWPPGPPPLLVQLVTTSTQSDPCTSTSTSPAWRCSS